MNFGKEKEIEIFKALAVKSQYKVGLEFGFDKVYKNPRAVRNAVTQIYNRVKNNLDEYGLTQEVVDMVAQGMKTRALNATAGQTTLAETQDEIDIKDRIINIRDKTFKLIDKKLDRMSNSNKKLDAISFKDLGIIAGISFDKSQILKGEATEHIAVLGKIDTNISPEEALEAALKMREKTVEIKHDK